jgi:hypothetical protein
MPLSHDERHKRLEIHWDTVPNINKAMAFYISFGLVKKP